MSNLPSDIADWSADRLEYEIQALLPPNTSFTCEFQDVSWVGKLEGPGVSWRLEHEDKVALLYSAYGLLWSKDRKPTAPQWSSDKDRPTVKSVTQYVADKFKDLEDLDPAEIDSVYKHSKHK